MTALAAILRFVALLDQTPFHDEWHVLLAVKRLGPGAIASHFGRVDHSIPVALYLEFASRWGALGEVTLWLPFAIGGLLTSLALWWLARSRVGPSAAVTFFAFLACMPLLVLYSRFARPYGLAAPGCLLLILLLERWRQRPRLRFGAPCVLLTAAIGWSLPIYLPFCLGAWLATALMLRSPDARSTWPQLSSLGLAAGALLAGLLAPTLADLPTLAAKTGADGIDLDGVMRGVAMFFGARPSWLLAVWLPLIALGAGALHRRARGEAVAIGAAAVAQLGAIVVAAPAEISRSLVVARYLLPVGLSALFCAALATSELRIPRLGWRVGPALALVLCSAALAWQPPLVSGPGVENFRSTRLYQGLFFTRRQLTEWFRSPPVVYRELASLPPGSTPVVEVPYNGMLRTPYPYYQLHHRQPVYLGATVGACGIEDDREIPVGGTDGFAFTRFVAIDDLATMRDLGVRYIILHRDVESEVPWVRPETRRRHRFDFDACVALLARLTAQQPEGSDDLARFRLDPGST